MTNFEKDLEKYLEMASDSASRVCGLIKDDITRFLSLENSDKDKLDFGPDIHTYGPGIFQNLRKAIITTLGKCGYWPREDCLEKDYWPVDWNGRFRVVYEERKGPDGKMQYLLRKVRDQ